MVYTEVKKQKQRLRAKQGKAKKLTSIKSVYPQTQPHRTEYKSE